MRVYPRWTDPGIIADQRFAIPVRADRRFHGQRERTVVRILTIETTCD
ncbi:MAG: hypothetical protein Q4C47_01350 [Planctomycetia bacterium]|nr:hypothetical protein [Planctomycetia bacterium]